MPSPKQARNLAVNQSTIVQVGKLHHCQHVKYPREVRQAVLKSLGDADPARRDYLQQQQERAACFAARETALEVGLPLS